MLELVNVTKGYGSQLLLSAASLRIGDGERIGLVGANGSGKTTLFRLITGEETPDQGAVQGKKGLTVGFLPQEIDCESHGTVMDQVLEVREEYFEVLCKVRSLEQRLEEEGEQDDLLRERAYLAVHLEDHGGDTVTARAAEILSGLGFSEEGFRRDLSTLSGGWRMRVHLARLLMARPELMLLDEPTNHLDLPSMVWFENYLKSFDGTFIIVAHDREFLNRTVSRVIELDRGRVGQFQGDYDYYRRRKEDELVHRMKAFKSQQVRIRDLEDFIARNRVRKDRAKQVQSRIKLLDKIERIDAPTGAKELGFRFSQPPRTGAQVLSLVDVHKSYGDNKVLGGVSLSVSRGDKLALIGVNGMGKSTILKIAAGVLDFELGTATTGHNVTVGYFAQHQLEALVAERTVLDEMYTVAKEETVSQVRSVLGAFLFSGDDVDKKVAVLSGGEKSRLALAKLLLRPASLLIMDEPTNHLDIASREVLEEALRQFSGTLLFSSHDRRFIDAIATKSVEVDQGTLTEYMGNYTYYAWKKAELRAAQGGQAQASGGSSGSAREKTVRNGKKERKRMEAELRQALHREVGPLQQAAQALEQEIELLEQSIEALEHELADPNLYSVAPEKARDKSTELGANRRALDTRLDQWEETSLAVQSAEAEVCARFPDLQSVSQQKNA